MGRAVRGRRGSPPAGDVFLRLKLSQPGRMRTTVWSFAGSPSGMRDFSSRSRTASRGRSSRVLPPYTNWADSVWLGLDPCHNFVQGSAISAKTIRHRSAILHRTRRSERMARWIAAPNCAPERSAPCNSALSKSAPSRYARRRAAPCNFALRRLAPRNSAISRSAPCKSALLRSAPRNDPRRRSAPCKFAHPRSAPCNRALRRSAPCI